MREMRQVYVSLAAIFAACSADQSEAVTIRCHGTLQTTDDNYILDGHRTTSVDDALILVIDDERKSIEVYDPKEQRLDDVCGGSKCNITITDQEASWTEERQEPRWFLVQSGSVDRVAGTAERSILDKTLGANGETQHVTDVEAVYPSCEKYEEPLTLKKPKF